MRSLNTFSADVLEPVTLKDDDARLQPGAIEEQGMKQSRYSLVTDVAGRVARIARPHWMSELLKLVARFGHCVCAELVALTMSNLWGLYAFQRAFAARGG